MNNSNKIIVDAIYPAKAGNNPDYLTMQVSSETASKSIATGIFLKGNFTSRRVAFQSIHKDHLEAMSADGLAEGADLNEVTGGDFQIKVTEQTQPEFDALSEEDKKGYQAKQYKDEAGKVHMITAGGLQVYRRADLCGSAEGSDKLVASDKVATAAKATAPAGEEVEA